MDSALNVREQLIAQGRGIDACAEPCELVTPASPLHAQFVQAVHGSEPDTAIVPECDFEHDTLELGDEPRLGVGDEGAHEAQFRGRKR